MGSSTPSSTRTQHVFDTLNLAGSIASITGISLLTLNASLGTLTFVRVLGTGLGASIILGLLALVLALLRWLWSKVRRCGPPVSVAFWLLSIPPLLLALIFWARMIIELTQGFTNLAVTGRS
jgi:hypothetical protein